jgi:hypothetical protein
MEAHLELPQGGDPAAIGAAITVALCGHWEHGGPCRWPNHTAVEETGAGRATIRTVATAQPVDQAAVEAAIRRALAGGSLPDRAGATWVLIDARRVPLRGDEVDLVARIARPTQG